MTSADEAKRAQAQLDKRRAALPGADKPSKCADIIPIRSLAGPDLGVTPEQVTARLAQLDAEYRDQVDATFAAAGIASGRPYHRLIAGRVPPKPAQIVTSGAFVRGDLIVELETACAAACRILVLEGDTETGKTVAAAWWALQAATAGLGVGFVAAHSLNRATGWDDDEWQRVAGADAVVVDDAGRESPECARLIERAIWEVEAYPGRSILITTELDRDAFDGRYGGPACHRRTCGGCGRSGCSGGKGRRWIVCPERGQR